MQLSLSYISVAFLGAKGRVSTIGEGLVRRGGGREGGDMIDSFFSHLLSVVAPSCTSSLSSVRWRLAFYQQMFRVQPAVLEKLDIKVRSMTRGHG